MDRPQVIIHNLISLDGRLDGFPADAGLYYEMASRLPHQAVLTGSATMLAAAAGRGIDYRTKIPSRCLASPRPVRPRPGAGLADVRPGLCHAGSQTDASPARTGLLAPRAAGR